MEKNEDANLLLHVLDHLLRLRALVLRKLDELVVPAAELLLDVGVRVEELAEHVPARLLRERIQLLEPAAQHVRDLRRGRDVERALVLDVAVEALDLLVRAVRDLRRLVAVLVRDRVELVERGVDVRARTGDDARVALRDAAQVAQRVARAARLLERRGDGGRDTLACVGEVRGRLLRGLDVAVQAREAVGGVSAEQHRLWEAGERREQCI
jgi:hypothetical protein